MNATAGNAQGAEKSVKIPHEQDCSGKGGNIGGGDFDRWFYIRGKQRNYHLIGKKRGILTTMGGGGKSFVIKKGLSSVGGVNPFDLFRQLKRPSTCNFRKSTT